MSTTTFYFRSSRPRAGDAAAEPVIVCDPEHRHRTEREAIACASAAGRALDAILAVRGSSAKAPAAKAGAAELFTAALAALQERRRTECLRACQRIIQSTGRNAALHRAAVGLEFVAGHALVADNAAVIDLGREQLDRCFARIPAALRVRCEHAYYAAASKFVKDRNAEANGLQAFLERCEAHRVAGLAPLYRMLGKLQYGANRMQAARASFERGLACLRKKPDAVTELRIRVELGLAHAKLGDSVAAIELIEGAIARFVALDLNDDVVSGCAGAMYVYSCLSRFEEVRAWGTYALGRPAPSSPAWSAVLLYDVGAVDLMLGEPLRALERLEAQRSRIEPMGAGDLATIAAIEANALLLLDRFDEAEETLRVAMRHDSEQWVRLVLRGLQASLLELSGENERALEHALFVMNYPADDGNAMQCRSVAAIQVARLLYRLRIDRFAETRAACRALSKEHPLAAIAAEHAAAYERLFRCADRLAAMRLSTAARRHPDRFARAVNALEAARVTCDPAEVRALIGEFQAIGSATMAARARKLAERIDSGGFKLSARETELAQYVASGKTNVEIARLLGLSRKTVDNHISNILAKCGIRSRVEIAALVLRRELPERSSIA